MTPVQKQCFEILLRGGAITKHHPGYTIRDYAGFPVLRIAYRTLLKLKQWKVFKTEKRSGFAYVVISKRKIQKLRGNSWIKKRQKELRLSEIKSPVGCSGPFIKDAKPCEMNPLFCERPLPLDSCHQLIQRYAKT